jgi:hypothetical protein
VSGQLPFAKSSTLIVLAAFGRDAEGELRPAFEPRQMMSERRALEEARVMATNYAGVVVWSRDARPDEGEFGEPMILSAVVAFPS